MSPSLVYSDKKYVESAIYDERTFQTRGMQNAHLTISLQFEELPAIEVDHVVRAFRYPSL